MNKDYAECGHLTQLLGEMSQYLDKYFKFEHPDAMKNGAW